MKFKEVIDTTAAPAAAFRFLSDFNNLPAWDPSIVRVERLTAGPISVGTRFLVTLRFLGVESALDYRVEEYEPNRRAVLMGTATTVTATDTVLVEPHRGGCRVTWDADIRFAGPLRLLDPLFAWLFAASVRSAIANLRRELGRLRRRQAAAT
jgi:carbon monoxide dehydrogenase subunit G